MSIRRLVVAVVTTALIATACGDDDTDNRYDAQVRDLYLEGCTEEGDPAFCECTLREIESRYTQEEFVRHSVDAAAGYDTPIDFVEIAMACLE
jgi:hypothetical protein